MLQILTFLLALLHPYYVSVTEIKHDAKSQSLEVSCRLFSDDLETALNKMGQGKVDILNPKNSNQINDLIARYVPQHLKITVNGKPLMLKFIGYEQESEATWCYFEVVGVRSAKNIGISNDLLYAEHEEQINMLHVTVGGVRKSTKLDNPERKAVFQF
jgi:hypothetical protein